MREPLLVLGVIVFGLFVFFGLTAHFPLSAERRRQLTANIEIRNLISGIERYNVDCGVYPSAADGLNVLLNPSRDPCWNGPYAEEPLHTDPWGRPFEYRFDDLGPEVVSYGADGIPGGEFFGTDVSSRRLWVMSPTSPEETRALWIALALWGGNCVGFIACLVLLCRESWRPRVRIRT